jgi:thymidylate kinase
MELEDSFEYMQSITCKEVRPNIYIFLQFPSADGIERTKGRSDNNHFDSKELSFHDRVRVGFQQFQRNHPHAVIDASGAEEEVLGRALIVINEVLACP